MLSMYFVAFTLIVSGKADAGVVDNGDGTYHHELASGLSTSAFWEGPIQWQYDGQQDFPWAPDPITSRLLDDDLEPDPPGAGEHALWDTVMVDEYGRRWVVGNINESALLVKIADYDLLIQEPQVTPGPAPAQLADSGETMLWEPWSWSSPGSCSNQQLALWNLESRDLFLPSATAEEKKTGALFNANGVFQCSGFFVDKDDFVTAAHCVTDNAGRKIDTKDWQVCTLGNYQPAAHCVDVGRNIIANQFDDGSTLKERSWDLAVFRLKGLLGFGRWMGLSSASNSTIKSFDAHLSGYPKWFPDCNWHVTQVPGQMNVVLGASGYGDVIGTATLLRTRNDGSAGMSGSVLYYYPSGSLDFAVGVLSGFFYRPWGTSFSGGPRMNNRRGWIIGLM